jgi:hypothetical protein
MINYERWADKLGMTDEDLRKALDPNNVPPELPEITNIP